MLSPEITIDRERVELESKVLAAAMRQSVDLGDASGADLAHKALFYLLRSHQESAAYRLMARPIFQPVVRHESNGGGAHAEHGNGHNQIPAAPRPLAATTELSEDYLPNLAKLFSDDNDPPDSNEPTATPPQTWQRPPAADANQIKARPRQVKTSPTPAAAAAPPAPVAPPPPVKVEREYVITAEMEKFLDTIAQAKDVYSLLGVSQYSSYELIHKSFLKRVRKLLLVRSKGGYQRRVLDLLRSIWIAHDILVDPNTRNDYDFRVLGLRGQPDSGIGKMPEDRHSMSDSNQAPLKIGELMQASGLLEPTELEIACDMHKAMPEMQFGRFLVKQGFIEEYQLQAVLLGQRLIRDGKLTVSQFQELMTAVKDSVQDFKTAALEKAFVTKTDITKAEEEEEEAMATKILASLPPKTSARNIAAFSLPTIGKLEDDGQPADASPSKEIETAQAPLALSEVAPAAEIPASKVEEVPEESEPIQTPPLEWKSMNPSEEAAPVLKSPSKPFDEPEASLADPPAASNVEPAAAVEPPAAVKAQPDSTEKKTITHSRQKSEIKITNARLLSLLEEHERKANSPSDHDEGVFSTDNQLLTEIDLIDESEIEPDLSRSNPSPGDANKKRKKK